MHPLRIEDLLFIVTAARWTILLSLSAFIGGACGGVLVALARTSQCRWLRIVSAGYVLTFQGTPVLLQLLVAFFMPSLIGISIAPWTAAAIALTLRGSALLGEIWRGAIESVENGQWEASKSLGLSYPTTMISVIVPQATKIAIPPTIVFLVELIKDTSLASVIGFVEVMRAAELVNTRTFRAFVVYSFAALIFYAICRPLSAFGRRKEIELHNKLK